MRKIIISLLVAVSILWSNQLKAEDRTEWILVELGKCESGLNSQALNPDDGGSPSVGKYQFKFDTFKGFVQKYHMLNLDIMEESDIWNWMYDGDFQTKLVRKIIENEPNWFYHWKNCTKTIGVW